IFHSDSPNEGGSDTASTPEEMLLGALGSCMAMTAKMYSNRKGWNVTRIDVTLSLKRVNGKEYAQYEGDAPFIHEITEEVRFEGDLDADQLARLHEITHKCPVRRILANPVFFVQPVPEN
ncbi:MAG: OsmC family protein, partial [Anaerolineae bacterium]|nr:OsmC family protein [Anaerolineae bacterium]